MNNLNLSSLNSSLMEGQQILFPFDDDNCNIIDECNLKHEKPDLDVLKHVSIITNSHELKVVIENPYCPYCHSKRLVFNGTHSRSVQLKDIGDKNVVIQHYRCKRCGKTFYGHLDKYVEPYKHVENDVKKDIHWMYGFLHSSLRNIRKMIKKFSKISISHQTINNILYNENLSEFHEYDDEYGGYYEFDEEWSRNRKEWFIDMFYLIQYEI